MEKRLNENEVKEIAKMQKKIDSYEGFIKAASIMAHSGKKINYPLFDGTKYTQEMGYIWNFIKKHMDIK